MGVFFTPLMQAQIENKAKRDKCVTKNQGVTNVSTCPSRRATMRSDTGFTRAPALARMLKCTCGSSLSTPESTLTHRLLNLLQLAPFSPRVRPPPSQHERRGDISLCSSCSRHLSIITPHLIPPCPFLNPILILPCPY